MALSSPPSRSAQVIPALFTSSLRTVSVRISMPIPEVCTVLMVCESQFGNIVCSCSIKRAWSRPRTRATKAKEAESRKSPDSDPRGRSRATLPHRKSDRGTSSAPSRLPSDHRYKSGFPLNHPTANPPSPIQERRLRMVTQQSRACTRDRSNMSFACIGGV